MRLHLRDFKIRHKILVLILVASITPVVFLSVIFAGRLYQMLVSDTIRKEQEAMSQTGPIISDKLEDLSSATDEILADAFADSLFVGIPDEPLENLLLGDDAETFSALCRETAAAHGLSAIRIYIDMPSEDSLFASLPPDSVFGSLDEVRSAYWRGIFYTTYITELYCPPLYMNKNEAKLYGDCAYIRLVTIKQSDETIKCYIVSYFNSEDIKDILSTYLYHDGSVSYITNDRDAVVASTDESLSGIYYMNYADIMDNLLQSNSFLTQEVLGETVYLSSYALSEADWLLVTVTPSYPVMVQTRQIYFIFIVILLLVLSITVFLTYMLSRNLTKRISRVSQQMAKVRKELPVPMEEPAEKDEIGDLVRSYNYMATRINTLIGEKETAARELRTAEYNSLQAQINPHFLYNSMEMINWMAQEGRNKDVSDAVHSLSQFYRMTLKHKDSISTIADELKHISVYVRIQNMRFDDGINLVIDIPEELYECRIPHLTLQPIVENSILHGILEKNEKSGTIVITGWIEKSTVVLLVSDDGVGMTQEQCRTILLPAKDESMNGSSHIAVYNIHRRIQILYGKEYGLSYRSEGHGTEVEIRIPADEGETADT